MCFACSDIGVKWSWEGLWHDSEHAVVPTIYGADVMKADTKARNLQ